MPWCPVNIYSVLIFIFKNEFVCSEIVLRKIEQKAKLWNTFDDKLIKSYQLQAVTVLIVSDLTCYFLEKVYQKQQL